MIASLYYFLPVLVANAVPVLVRRLNFLNTPISKHLFGKNKTVRGFVCGVTAGMLVYAVQYYLFYLDILSGISLINYVDMPILLGLLLPLGALLGDLFESYVKRRLHKKPGSNWYPYDQYDFIVGALIVSAPVYIVQGPVLLVALTVIPLLSFISSKLAVKLQMKG